MITDGRGETAIGGTSGPGGVPLTRETRGERGDEGREEERKRFGQ